MTNPTIGIIHARDKHPSAKLLATLQDQEQASHVLADAQLPLKEALERTWEHDSHLMMYRVDADQQGKEYAFARASKRSPFVAQLAQAGGRVQVTTLVFDHDLPKLPDGTKQEWSADSLDEFVLVLKEAVGSSIPEPTCWYTTLHGSRFVYALSSEVSHREAEALMRGLLEQFARAGIELDQSCKDWTRLFRLPRTTREDTGIPYEPAALLTDGPALDPATVHAVALSERDDAFVEVSAYNASRPDPDECRDLWLDENERGNKVTSRLVRAAKTFLQGREAFAVVFEHAPLAQGEDNWNTQVTKIVGQVVGMLARQEGVSAEGVYALLFAGIEQLQDREIRGANQTDWYAETWDLVCRMWASEQAQIQAELAEQEVLAAEAAAHRASLIEKVKAARPDDVPEDEDEAHEWFSRRMIASTGRAHHVMNRDGNYNTRPVPDQLLIPMIRELEMEGTIPTTEIRGKQLVMRSSGALINDHATPITAIECSARDDVAYIDGPAGHKVLHIPVHRLNPKLRPDGRFDPRVDRWLEALGGDQYDQLVEWLSHSLDVRRAICALNLYGSPGTGKGMLAAGLSECFEGEQRNDGRALGKFNQGLLDSPIVNCDEGVPKISSDEALTVDQAFRTMVTGGRLTIRAMHRDPFNADIYPRILFTSNDRDIIRSIVGHRDLTPDDIRAIELRLLSIEVSPKAMTLLTRSGNYSHTHGWVAGERRSDYVVANHIYYLFLNRKAPQAGSGRLLVEGQTSTDLVREMRLRSKGAQTVLRALVKMLEAPQQRRGMHVHAARAWATPAGLVEFAESAMPANDQLTLPVAGRVLKQFSADVLGDDKVKMSSPPGTYREQRARWVEIDLGLVFEEGSRYGIIMDRVQTLLSQQPGGPEKIAAIDDIKTRKSK